MISPTAPTTEGGIMLDHACGVVIGATAEVGARTIFYHQVRRRRGFGLLV
jgi:serine acetyltransferase